MSSLTSVLITYDVLESLYSNGRYGAFGHKSSDSSQTLLNSLVNIPHLSGIALRESLDKLLEKNTETLNSSDIAELSLYIQNSLYLVEAFRNQTSIDSTESLRDRELRYAIDENVQIVVAPFPAFYQQRLEQLAANDSPNNVPNIKVIQTEEFIKELHIEASKVTLEALLHQLIDSSDVPSETFKSNPQSSHSAPAKSSGATPFDAAPHLRQILELNGWSGTMISTMLPTLMLVVVIKLMNDSVRQPDAVQLRFVDLIANLANQFAGALSDSNSSDLLDEAIANPVEPAAEQAVDGEREQNDFPASTLEALEQIIDKPNKLTKPAKDSAHESAISLESTSTPEPPLLSTTQPSQFRAAQFRLAFEVIDAPKANLPPSLSANPKSYLLESTDNDVPLLEGSSLAGASEFESASELPDLSNMRQSLSTSEPPSTSEPDDRQASDSTGESGSNGESENSAEPQTDEPEDNGGSSMPNDGANNDSDPDLQDQPSSSFEPEMSGEPDGESGSDEEEQSPSPVGDDIVIPDDDEQVAGPDQPSDPEPPEPSEPSPPAASPTIIGNPQDALPPGELPPIGITDGGEVRMGGELVISGEIVVYGFQGVGVGIDNPNESFSMLVFDDPNLSPDQLLLTQLNNDLVITFEGVVALTITLKSFNLEDLDNLPLSTDTEADGSLIGNIKFANYSDEDTFDIIDVFNAGEGKAELSDYGLTEFSFEDDYFDPVFESNKTTFLSNNANVVSGFDNGNDVINAQEGDDILWGKAGRDTLRGQAGDDILNGGVGDDVLTGGSGSDRFVLSANTGADTITDFTLGEDTIVLLDGLSISEQQIQSQEGNTVIRLGNQSIATLENVDTKSFIQHIGTHVTQGLELGDEPLTS